MRGERGRPPAWLAAWCGWVLAGLFALIPLLGWLGTLGFAAAMALAGLLTLPAFHLRRDDWPVGLALLALIAWSVVSMTWSPFHPPDLEATTALKFAVQAPLYWSVVCAARYASPAARRLALRLFAWGVGLLAAVLLVEALSGAAIYQAIRNAFTDDFDPARWDLAQRNVARGAFVLAMLWAPASLAALRVGGPKWLFVLPLAALLALTLAFAPLAPFLALVVGLAAALAAMRWPKGAPWTLAVAAGLFFLAAPWLVTLARSLDLLAPLQAAVSQSWADRVGYWDKAAEFIAADPLRGWGLDASRVFDPHIVLHPHNGPLQVWLELGLLGALAAAAFWALVFLRIARPRPGLIAAAQAASAAAYVVIGAVSFGVWQEWWLALGALAAAACAAVQRQPAAVAQARMRAAAG